MNDRHLCLVSRAIPESSSCIQGHHHLESQRLWSIARNEQAHPLLREPAIVELSRRKETGAMELCGTLLRSPNVEEWFVAVRALIAMGTHEALERLTGLYARSKDWKRRYVFMSIARILTAEYIRPFQLMAKDFVTMERLDVTGWTRTAILTMKSVCNRYGVKVLDRTQKKRCISGRNISQTEQTILIEKT